MPGHWYDYPVTQGYNPPKEYGNDIGTPFHTSITELYGGTVFIADYKPWGGEVGVRVNVPGVGIVNEYYQHFDIVNVHPGQQIKAGDLLGLSGGQLSGGSHPTTSQYSSGPHMEYGFGAPWIGGGQNYNSIQSLIDAKTGKIGGGNVPVPGDACTGCGAVGSAAYINCTAQVAIGFVPDCAKQGVITAPITVPGLPSLPSLAGVDTFFTGLSNVNWADVGIRTGLVIGGGILLIIAFVIMMRDAK